MATDLRMGAGGGRDPDGQQAPDLRPDPQPGRPLGSEIPEDLALAFAPLDKRAFGAAAGLTAGLTVFALTAFHVIVRPQGFEPWLLGQYFYGYTISWPGALIGFAWAFFAGFVAGWFTAFCRNLALAAWAFIGLTKAELGATRDFLDHV